MTESRGDKPNNSHPIRRIYHIFWAALLMVSSQVAMAGPLMFVHDVDGNLGTVDVTTGQADVIGNLGLQMQDIAFDSAGNLFGLSHRDFYAIDRQTANVTRINTHGVPGANALVFSDTGSLYAAGYASTGLYSIDPTTGLSTALGSMNYRSAGDLAFYEGDFFLASLSDELVRVDLADLSNSTAVGSFGVEDVFGLATGSDDVFYGVAGTRIYQVDPTSGAVINPVDFGGQGLGQAYGQAFYTEAGADPIGVAEPASLWLAAIAFTGLGVAATRKRSC